MKEESYEYDEDKIHIVSVKTRYSMLQCIFNNMLHISNKYLVFYIYTIIYTMH